VTWGSDNHLLIRVIAPPILHNRVHRARHTVRLIVIIMGKDTGQDNMPVAQEERRAVPRTVGRARGAMIMERVVTVDGRVQRISHCNNMVASVTTTVIRIRMEKDDPRRLL